jgi:hypothetical protein
MRIKNYCDGKEEYPLASSDSREAAETFIKKERRCAALALYPSLSADIGLLSRSPLWGREVTPEAMRAISYYFGVQLGWPLELAEVSCENGKTISVPLSRNPLSDISEKINICKEMFEKTIVFAPFASHAAVRFRSPFEFILVESECVDAVDPSLSESLFSKDAPRLGLPVCFASLENRSLRLRAVVRGIGETVADDAMYMRALAYFYFVGRAEARILYEAAGGAYRVLGASAVESLRKISPIMNM